MEVNLSVKKTTHKCSVIIMLDHIICQKILFSIRSESLFVKKSQCLVICICQYLEDISVAQLFL